MRGFGVLGRRRCSDVLADVVVAAKYERGLALASAARKQVTGGDAF